MQKVYIMLKRKDLSATVCSFILLFPVLFPLPAECGDDDTQKEPETLRLTALEETPAVYDGTVEYARNAILSFEAKGRLLYVAPLGLYVNSEVLDVDGSIAVQGDLLARQDTDIPESDVAISRVLLKRAEAVLKDRAENYQRDKALSGNNVVSMRQYQETQMLYDTAVYDKEKALLDLKRAEQVLDACFLRTPFNAVVTQVFRYEGSSVDVGNPVLQISMIDPVKITVNLPDEAVQRMAGMIQVVVYPETSETPVAAWLEGPDLAGGKIECYTDNPRLLTPAVGKDGKQLPLIDELSAVQLMPGKQSLAPLWVAENTIRKDSDGSCFVWRLKDDNPNQERKRIEGQPLLLRKVNRLEKVPVVLTDFQIQYGNILLRGLKKAEGLHAGDVLAGDVPPDVRENETVVYRRKRHRFQIGEKVKVAFYSGYAGHIFAVPDEALVKNSENSGFHVLLKMKNAAPKKIPVILMEENFREKKRIYSPELSSGMEILLP